MTNRTVTISYVVQALLSSGSWADASAAVEDLHDARRIVRQAAEANVGNRLRVIERRVITVEEVLP